MLVSKWIARGQREWPVVMGNVSRGIAMPVLAIAVVQYANLLVRKPASEVYPVALTAFGLVGALAAICLSTAGPIGSETTPGVLRYAGEKLLHATVLLLQVLFVIFARDAVLAQVWIAGRGWLKGIVSVGTNTVASMVVLAAALSVYWGLESLNDELWLNWRRRVGSSGPKQPAATAERGGEAPPPDFSI